MRFSGMKSFFLMFVLLLILSSGCSMVQQPVNKSSGPMAIIGNLAPVPSQPSTQTFIVKDIPNPLPIQRTNQRLYIVREKPFMIKGSVENRSITKVQVWMVNSTIATQIIPVMNDGTFNISLSSSDTTLLSRNSVSAIVVQYPSYPDHFIVNWNAIARKITGLPGSPERILSEYKSYDTDDLVDYLDQTITRSGNGSSCDIYYLIGADAWIDLAPVKSGSAGTLIILGNTSLPTGTPLSISVDTVNMHPTPMNYDWSHEKADGSAVVGAGTNGINSFMRIIDISRLNMGKYDVYVTTRGLGREDPIRAEAFRYIEITAQTPVQMKPGNYINWSALQLPSLVLNKTMAPVMLEGEWTIVPSGTQRKNNDVPYDSIIDYGPDGVCRIFDQSGVQFLAVYDSNEALMMGVPNGAAIDTGSIGNVTLVKLNGKTILTKIDEFSSVG
jgi:hypothetical protein